jgi:hypothetical protein
MLSVLLLIAIAADNPDEAESSLLSDQRGEWVRKVVRRPGGCVQISDT